ncbi:MAG: GntR family transcriptional regulator [Planctomycetaceae bacterium]|nr:GntR family transcriptional regulator [Planctomycetaceae bacterium]
MSGRSGKSVSQRERVVEALQQEILNGTRHPGEALRQIPLSELYEVSQGVIRESLQSLSQQGLVVGTARGFAVRSFERQELVDAYRVREVLEGLAARLCCRKISHDDVDTLRELAEQIYAARGPRSRSKRSDLEYRFHQAFLSLSGNETLMRVSVGYRFVGNLVVTERDADQLRSEHLAVVEAVAANRPAEAERLARRHVALSAESIVNCDR